MSDTAKLVKENLHIYQLIKQEDGSELKTDVTTDVYHHAIDLLADIIKKCQNEAAYKKFIINETSIEVVSLNNTRLRVKLL